MRKQSKPSDPRIAEIMSSFNFERVYKVMHTLGWTWIHSKQPDRIPNIKEIRACAREYLNAVANSKTTIRTGSCGFMAERHPSGILELRFELDTAQGFPANFQEEE